MGGRRVSIETFARLVKENKEPKVIAQELGISRTSAYRILRRLEIQMKENPPKEIILQETFQALRRQRIELLKAQVEKIKAELSNRDLSQLSTEMLFLLLLRYSKAVEWEAIDPVFREMSQDEIAEIMKLVQMLPVPSQNTGAGA